MDSLGAIKEGSLEGVMSTMRLKGYKRNLPNKEMAETLLVKKKRRKKEIAKKGIFYAEASQVVWVGH